MSSRPTVTVIVPGHDVAPYAHEALASLQAQTQTDWVAILVDDASTDATGEIFAHAAAADPRFHLVRLPRQAGLGAARNLGLSRVDTRFVAFLDADDVLTPNALARLSATLEASGSDFVAGAYVRLRPDGVGGYAPGEVQPWVAAATDPARTGITIEEHPDASANVVAWSKLSRAEFWERTGLRFPERRLYEDQIVAQRMYTQARRFDVIPDVVAHWRVRADGTSITQRETQLEVLRECLTAMDGGLRVLESSGHPRAAQARVRQILSMDLPRLAEIARTHPTDEYRRTLGAFARTVWDRADSARARLDAPTEAVIAAVRLW